MASDVLAEEEPETAWAAPAIAGLLSTAAQGALTAAIAYASYVSGRIAQGLSGMYGFGQGQGPNFYLVVVRVVFDDTNYARTRRL